MKIFALLLALLALFLQVTPSYASFVVIEDSGEIVFNVLSEQDSIALGSRESTVKARKVGDEEVQESTVRLSRSGGEVKLTVIENGLERDMNVTKMEGDLIEIEERPEVQKIAIGVKDDKFSLEQNGVIALTSFPLKIDAERAVLSVTTSRGEEFLNIMPYEAVKIALRTRLLTKVPKTGVEITESEGLLKYKVEGTKVFDFFGIYQYSIPVTAFISTSTGEIVSIDSSTWFKYLKFLYI